MKESKKCRPCHHHSESHVSAGNRGLRQIENCTCKHCCVWNGNVWIWSCNLKNSSLVHSVNDFEQYRPMNILCYWYTLDNVDSQVCRLGTYTCRSDGVPLIDIFNKIIIAFLRWVPYLCHDIMCWTGFGIEEYLVQLRPLFLTGSTVTWKQRFLLNTKVQFENVVRAALKGSALEDQGQTAFDLLKLVVTV